MGESQQQRLGLRSQVAPEKGRMCGDDVLDRYIPMHSDSILDIARQCGVLIGPMARDTETRWQMRVAALPYVLSLAAIPLVNLCSSSVYIHGLELLRQGDRPGFWAHDYISSRWALPLVVLVRPIRFYALDSCTAPSHAVSLPSGMCPAKLGHSTESSCVALSAVLMNGYMPMQHL